MSQADLQSILQVHIKYYIVYKKNLPAALLPPSNQDFQTAFVIHFSVQKLMMPSEKRWRHPQHLRRGHFPACATTSHRTDLPSSPGEAWLDQATPLQWTCQLMYCICEVGDESLREKKTQGICQNSWVSPHHQSSTQLLAMSHLWQSIDSTKIDFSKNRYF